MDINNIVREFGDSNACGKKNTSSFEQIIIPIPEYKATIIKYINTCKDKNGKPTFKNAAASAIILGNSGKKYLKMTDIYDERGEIKFKQIELFPIMSFGAKNSSVKFKFVHGQSGDPVFYISETEYQDNCGNIWRERNFKPEDTSLNKFYTCPGKYTEFNDSDGSLILLPYEKITDIDKLIKEKFKCSKAQLASFLVNNFQKALNYIDISVDQIENMPPDILEYLFLD